MPKPFFPLSCLPPSGKWLTLATGDLVWRPQDAACALALDAKLLLSCFRGAHVYFVGDSVSREGVAFFAMKMAGCDDAPNSPLCRHATQWHVNDCDGACTRKDVRASFTFPDGGVTLYDVRAKLVDDLYYPLHWGAPSSAGGTGVDFFRDFLYLDEPPFSPENTAIVLNVGQWHMHFDADPIAYASRVQEYVDHLVRETRWSDVSLRRSGVLTWRSLTPTEQSNHTRESLRHVVDLLAHYRRADNNVTAIWRRAGFPIAELQSVAYHPDGTIRRTLTHDSTHFHRNISDVVFGYVFAQLCASLCKRRQFAALTESQVTTATALRVSGKWSARQSHLSWYDSTELFSTSLVFFVLCIATKFWFRWPRVFSKNSK